MLNKKTSRSRKLVIDSSNDSKASFRLPASFEGSTLSLETYLVALCAEFCQFERSVEKVIEDARSAEQQHNPDNAWIRVKQQEDLIDRIVAIPATKMEGLRAKAECALVYGADGYDANGCLGDRVLASILSDLVGFAVLDEVQGEQEMRSRL